MNYAVLVSGRGSNLKAILEGVKAGSLQANIVCCISNNPDALALQIATEHGVPAHAVVSRGKARTDHEIEVLNCLARYKVDYIVLAGYMRVLTPNFLKSFYDDNLNIYKVVNVHPSLLPAFPGASGYEDAFNYGVRLSGVTVHLVDEEVDHGPILAQETFMRYEDDTLETFKQRGLTLEHRLYPQILNEIATQGVKILPASRKGETKTEAPVK
jgi:phosphoribosylglycinamide formyltransferase-1